MNRPSFRSLFPGHQAGASLKHVDLGPVRNARQLRALPRSPSRGLIEASASSANSDTAPGLFPGHQAGASLKPNRSRNCSMRRLALPRSPSRGLIEAGCCCRTAEAGIGLFPGHQAGASLKRLKDWARPRYPLDLFPGHQAGASLKRGRGEAILLLPLPLPRSPSRGLIEADCTRTLGNWVACLFPGHQAGASLKHPLLVRGRGPPPAALPRSPSRGLIEAASSGSSCSRAT